MYQGQLICHLVTTHIDPRSTFIYSRTENDIRPLLDRIKDFVVLMFLGLVKQTAFMWFI